MQPPTKYSFSVSSGTLGSAIRSWMTSLASSKSTVETSASPASLRCFFSSALKPPMVSAPDRTSDTSDPLNPMIIIIVQPLFIGICFYHNQILIVKHIHGFV